MTEARTFLGRVQDFANGPVAAAAPAWTLGEVPGPRLYREAASTGLLNMTIPQEFGGQGFDYATLVQACESLAAVDFGWAMSLVNTHNVGLRLCHSARPEIRDRYLPRLMAGEISACTALTEPGAGSDFAAITTRAEDTGSGWRLTGEKTWIVNGRHAGLAVVFAQCGADGDARGIGGFLVDLTSPGVRRYPVDSGFAQGSMGTGGFLLDGVMLDRDALVLPAGGAFKSVMTEINAARTYVAAMCNAMLGAALSRATAYGDTRQSFGKPLSGYPSWQAPLDQARGDLAASRSLTAEAVGLVGSGGDAQLAAARAKIAAVRAAQRHLPELLHAMGAEGLRPGHCFTRHLQAAQIAGLTDGATNLLQDRVEKLTRLRPEKSEN